MDMLILTLFALFCGAILFLLLRLLRNQGPGAAVDAGSAQPLKEEIEKWETRWKMDREDAEKRQSELQESIDREKLQAAACRPMWPS